MCGIGEYVPFRVMENETIYLMDQQLSPGTYCLPKGIGNCNQKTSFHVFSAAGWTCVPRNTSIFQDACHNEEAANNEQNVLWDYSKNEPAKDVENPYETMSDGSLRYRCQCGSKDIRGKRLVPTLPFVCSVDYCVQDIPNSIPLMKFKDSKCECGPYLHATDREESPCVVERTRVERNTTLVGRVDCMADFSWKKRPIFCPKEEGALSFTTFFLHGESFTDFIKKMS